VSGKPTVAVLGTGTIGKPAARNLAHAGFPVHAWNRTRQRSALLSADGVLVAASLQEAVAEADVLMTFLSDGPSVEEVMDDAASAARAGATWIQSSTVGIPATERLAELASDYRLVFVDAPVLGTKEPAEKGELVVFASGPKEAEERCEPIFDAIGKATRWVGEAGAGQRFKLVINTWLLAAVEGVAEAISLARGLGLDPNEVLDALSGGPLDMPYLQLKGKSDDRARLRAELQGVARGEGRGPRARSRRTRRAGAPASRGCARGLRTGRRARACRQGHGVRR
jgi:3-hydroxyisobutyrate dehydrogenase